MANLTEAQFKALKDGMKQRKEVHSRIKVAAKGREMNSLEARRAAYLSALQFSGEIKGYKFEQIKFKLADNTHYTPDFMVWMKDGSLVIEETKGFMRDDAAVKLKVAAFMFPMFTFRLVRWVKGQWVIKTIPSVQ